MKVWIDLDNSPHVHFFAPIIRELQKKGIETVITVRVCSQTQELAREHGLDFTVVGRHYETPNLFVKVSGTFLRAWDLARFIRKQGVSLAISHGSRALVLGASLLRIPIITLYDYEFASYRLFNLLSDRLFAPFVIPVERLTAQGLDPKKLVKYPGLKEEVYVYEFTPDPAIDAEVGRDMSRQLVTLRPPATSAHYHDKKSDELFDALLQRLGSEPTIQTVILARSESQAQEIRSKYKLDADRFIVRSKALDGLSLMWRSSAVFSGGGTMTREAALLGLNVFSVFGGRIGAADEFLESTGRLRIVRKVEELATLPLSKAARTQVPADEKHVAAFITEEIVRFARERSPQ